MRSFQVFVALVQSREEKRAGRVFVAAENIHQARRAMSLEGRRVRSLHLWRNLHDLQCAVFDAIDQRIPAARAWLADRYVEGFRFVLWRPGDLSLHVAVSVEQGEDRVIYDLTAPYDVTLAAIRLAHLRFRKEHPLPPRSEVCDAAAE